MGFSRRSTGPSTPRSTGATGARWSSSCATPSATDSAPCSWWRRALVGVALLVLIPLAVLSAHPSGGPAPRGRRRGSWQRSPCVWLVARPGWTCAAAAGRRSRRATPRATSTPRSAGSRRSCATSGSSPRLRRRTHCAGVPADELLTGLRGKDVLFVFVESYGRVAVEGSSFSAGVNEVLAAGTQQLDSAGFSSRSAFLTSPTFGAISWLAHSTLQSGLWVDSQQRYDVLVDEHPAHPEPGLRAGGLAHRRRRTGQHPRLAAGRVLRLRPASTTRATSATRARGSATPRCPTSTPSTRSTASSSRASDRRPVMAEIDLITSHAPWSRTPRMVDQAAVGDGSVFDGMPEQLPSETDIWPSPERVRAAYGESIEYSLSAPVSFVAHVRRRRPASWSSSATTSRRPSSRARTPATTCRSRSSPATRPSSTGSPAGAGTTG